MGIKSDTTINPAELPEDISLLKDMICGLVSSIHQKDHRISVLEHQLSQLLRARYGPSAEKIDAAQLLLFARQFLAVEAKKDAQEPQPERKRDGHGRRALPRELPRRRIVHEVLQEERLCGCCGSEMVRIGEETSEQLEYVPASFCVLEHVRPKYACMHCGDGTVVRGDKARQPIEKGLPGPGLLAHVVTSKYADHLPLHRLEGIFARHGVEVSRSTMCDWMLSCAGLLGPLHGEMKRLVFESKVINTDDTPLPVQDEKRQSTRKGRLWAYVGDKLHPYVVYDYTPNRKRDGPVNFLGEYKGYLQADAFSGYDGIYAGEKVIEVGCWAHARRKFYESRDSEPELAHIALGWIRSLYEVEREAKELSTSERYRLRQERSVELLAGFEEWLKKQQVSVLPKSPMGKAISYALSNWGALTRYVEDGDLSIDNNAAERAMRRVALGRKNYLFVGSDRGGEAAAVLYSFVATCRRHGIDPFRYLRDVLARISDHKASRLAELLPGNWTPADQAESEATSESPAA